VTFYLIAYFVATAGAFGVIATLSGPERDADRIDDYRGLFWTRPWLAGVFTGMLLSLAGIPLTALHRQVLPCSGRAQSSLWALIIILVTTKASSGSSIHPDHRRDVHAAFREVEAPRLPALPPLSEDSYWR
jgi:NADH-quinone oxidoreductase subunit N